MKFKYKVNLIDWLYALMLFPIGIIIITAFFIALAIFFSEVQQTIPYDQIFVEGLLLVIFIIFYFVIVVLKKEYILFSDESIILRKNSTITNIKYNDVVSLRFYKTSVFLLPLIIFTNGNTLVIDYTIDNQEQKSKKVKVFYRNIKKIKNSLNYKIEIKKASFN
ncbi:MAG: hypothetical protein ACLFPM_06180 [Candidatus Izemoplasmatales bacterium]